MPPIARYLEAGFEGFFMCRLATDPDPNNERRGRSGYTMALSGEDPLDQVIRLQADDYVRRNLRAPASSMGIDVGVRVTSVRFDGKPWAGSPNLVNAEVRLLGHEDIFPGPIFESRNNVVGSDDSLAFAISPFHLAIDKHHGSGAPLLGIRAVDHLNPADPEQPIWRIEDPTVYGRRLPTAFDSSSSEVMEALGVFDFYAYFRDRRIFLHDEIARLQALLGNALEPEEQASIGLAIEETRSRIFQLELWGDRVINKLGFQLRWEFDINGHQSVEGDLGGRPSLDQPWHVWLWCGGWDGDLLIGYLRGALSIPFEPPGTEQA
jgi:hypothetical protein